jgi:hypothetical protein
MFEFTIINNELIEFFIIFVVLVLICYVFSQFNRMLNILAVIVSVIILYELELSNTIIYQIFFVIFILINVFLIIRGKN